MPSFPTQASSQQNWDWLRQLIFWGNGSPENVVRARVGAHYHRLDGGAGTSFYVKEGGGTGPTGWAAK